MSDWMAHVYMQQPLPSNVTGVTVTLSVLDANNNYRTIGTTTTDVKRILQLTHTHQKSSGKYTVYASFGGTGIILAIEYRNSLRSCTSRINTSTNSITSRKLGQHL